MIYAEDKPSQWNIALLMEERWKFFYAKNVFQPQRETIFQLPTLSQQSKIQRANIAQFVAQLKRLFLKHLDLVVQVATNI